MERRPHSRVLLKLSGEALAGPLGFGLDKTTLDYVARQVAEAHAPGVQIAIVVGGGNFIRGDALASESGLSRTVADQMGMLGTLMNALALQSALENAGVSTRVQSAIQVSQVAESFIVRRAIRHLEKDRVVVFAAGTGNPYFTTDTAAVLRALEVEAGCLIKATKVDGIYTADPKKDPAATRFARISFDEAIGRDLKVMDATAFALCRDQKLPINVFSIFKAGGLKRVVMGEDEGTLVHC